MKLSQYALEKIGFEMLPKGQSIKATLFGLHIYKISGINLDEGQNSVFSWKIDDVSFKFSFGSDLNAMCRLLYEDDLVNDLTKWEKEKGCQPPYLAILFGPTTSYSVSDCYIQRKEGILTTCESFDKGKSDLKVISSSILPRLLTALTCEFSTLPHGVHFDFVDYVIFGETDEGERLNDLRFTTISASVTVSASLDDATLHERVGTAATLVERLQSEAAKFFELGLGEKDDLKAFIYFFLSIEISTHQRFQSNDHTALFQKLDRAEGKIQNASQVLFKLRNNKIGALKDRFDWCAICIWNEITDDDLKEFKALTKIRNEIAHGDITSANREQVNRVRNLAQRILRQ